MASIWNPDGTIVPGVNADLTVMYQEFTATASQTVFNLTTFVFQPATNSLFVLVNGVDQVLTQDYTEGAGGNSITFTSGLEVGDQVIIRGFVGSVASQTAAASASAAYISSQNSAASATASANSATNSATSAASSAAYAINSANSATASAISETNSANSATASAGSAAAASASATAANQTALPFAVAAGTSDTITANYATANTALVNGYNLTLEIVTPNTTATPTLNPTLSGVVQGAATIVKMINNTEVGLKPGDLQGYCWFKWNSVTSHWVFMNPLDSVLGGSIQVTSAVSLNLTVNSQRVQVVNMTASGQNVQLPDATTLKDNQGYFMISNQGRYTFNITDGAGNLLKLVSVGATIDCVQLSNATVAGQWLTKNSAYVNPLYQTLSNWGETVIANVAGIEPQLVKLTSNTFLLAYVATTIHTVVLTATNNVVSIGTVVDTGITPPAAWILCGLTNTTAALITTGASSTYYLTATVLSIAGTVITVNSSVVSALQARDGEFTAVGINTDQIFIGYASTVRWTGVVITVAGTVPTFNAPTVSTVSCSSISQLTCSLLGGSNNLVLFLAFSAVLVVSIAGTTCTFGTAATYSVGAGTSLFPISTTQAYIIATDSSTTSPPAVSLATITSTGSSVTVTAVPALSGFGAGLAVTFEGGGSVTSLVPGQSGIYYTDCLISSSYYQFGASYIFNSSSTLLSGPTTFDGYLQTTEYFTGAAIATVSTSEALVTYPNMSGYISARVISLN